MKKEQKREILELKRDVPQILLKILGYKRISKDSRCTIFQKKVIKKVRFDCSIDYDIYIFDEYVREICIALHYKKDKCRWARGKEALNFLYDLDKRLVKYAELRWIE